MIAIAVFDTAIGPCGIAWGRAGIVGVHLPEGAAADTLARLRDRFPSATEVSPPPDVTSAIAAITDHLDGRLSDLGSIVLDDTAVAPFDRRVYALARAIPPGEIRTYGDVAAALGDPTLARAVGQSLGRNPFAPVVPCHRVTAAGGRLGGFSATGGSDTKRRLLAIESAPVAPMLPFCD